MRARVCFSQEKAYDIAQNYEEMDTYVKFLGELGTPEVRLVIQETPTGTLGGARAVC